MRDFLKGMFGKLLQIVLTLLGFGLLLGGIFGGSTIAIIIGVLCLCAAFGVRYWLGHIVRYR
jgi:uncharacterized membrane protein YadS